MKLASYAAGRWQEGTGPGAAVFDAVSGDPVCEVSSEGIDFAAMVRHAHEVGSPALRAMTFHERAAALKAMPDLPATCWSPRGSHRVSPHG